MQVDLSIIVQISLECSSVQLFIAGRFVRNACYEIYKFARIIRSFFYFLLHIRCSISVKILMVFTDVSISFPSSVRSPFLIGSSCSQISLLMGNLLEHIINALQL